jgi:hypothetical protein
MLLLICSLFILLFLYVYCRSNCIGDVMVSVLTSSVVDRGFEPLSGLNILILSQQLLNAACLAEKQQIPIL